MPLPAQASPHFRFLLLNIGANITKLLVAKAKTPEDVAAAVGVDPETLYQIMSGREADVSISVLDGIFTALGATFVPNVVVPTNSSPSAA